jgi:hypothetical protein
MARAATTKTKAGFRTTLREPLGTNDHPLGPVAPTNDSPDSDFSQVPPHPSALTEEDSNPEQEDSARSEQEDSAPQVATVDDHEEDLEEEGLKPENPSLSEQDEALTEGEEDSSYCDASQFAAVPNLQRLVVLGSDHCHSPCHIKNKDGIKTPSICGKRAMSCQ